MKKIIYLFCLICTITLAKGQYYRLAGAVGYTAWDNRYERNDHPS